MLLLHHDMKKSSRIRDRSKFTRYLSRVLGKICPIKISSPPFLVDKMSSSPFFAPLFRSKKALHSFIIIFQNYPLNTVLKPLYVYIVYVS